MRSLFQLTGAVIGAVIGGFLGCTLAAYVTSESGPSGDSGTVAFLFSICAIIGLLVGVFACDFYPYYQRWQRLQEIKRLKAPPLDSASRISPPRKAQD